MQYQEAQKAQQGAKQANYYQETLRESAESRKDYKKRKGIVKAADMPWENSPQGKIKHVVNGKMNTRECALHVLFSAVNDAEKVDSAFGSAVGANLPIRGQIIAVLATCAPSSSCKAESTYWR